ncbi:MAG: aminopeptidase P family protein, partial [Lachnospiraceae bacterium]|nr:aminopeptidase P family protein [Lachnospiraceae bacterium]
VESLKPRLEKKNLTLSVKMDLVGEIWEDRPTLPQDPIFDFSAEYTGEARVERLARLRAKMAELGADYYLIASLESGAWLLNYRGNDVEDTPVALAYTLVGKDSCTLFIEESKVSADLKAVFARDGVEVRPYGAVPQTLASLPASSIAMDTGLINQLLYESIPADWTILPQNPDVVISMKGVKNETELKNMRYAHVKDGAVMAQFIYWLKSEMAKGTVMDECDAAAYLDDLRRSQENALGISFGTIAGYGSNGAIVHYGPKKETCAQLKPEGFLLVDSGAQYMEGTTDITRTIACGPLTDEMKFAYTLVLKGHLQLGHARFKEGITGTNLDILARKPLWDHDLDYKHGTGHGVGFVLSVHEGPMNISYGLNAVKLVPGMIISDEPGYYPTGKFGVRIENLIEVKKGQQNEWGQFHYMDSLTLCPYEREAIDLSLLTEQEISWVNEYHQRVWDEVSPLLAGKTEVLAWLKDATRPL